jgi:hypothetical protein
MACRTKLEAVVKGELEKLDRMFSSWFAYYIRLSHEHPWNEVRTFFCLDGDRRPMLAEGSSLNSGAGQDGQFFHFGATDGREPGIGLRRAGDVLSLVLAHVHGHISSWPALEMIVPAIRLTQLGVPFLLQFKNGRES